MSQRLRLVFAGTPEFAVPHLHACCRDGVEIAAVYTQPDRPAGRGRKLTSSAVKQAALEAGLAVEQPENFREAVARERLAAFAPDLIVVVAYGLILSRKVLAIPRLGCWNVHASLLPRWRGAEPIQRALLAGDRETGVCLMQMEAGLDSGPLLLRRALPIAPADTGGTLHDRLARLGAQVLGEGLQRVLQGAALPGSRQSEHGVTYAHKLDKAEARLDWNETALALERKVRAFDPWPVAEGEVAGETLRVWKAHGSGLGTRSAPQAGTLLAATRAGIDIACGDGVLRILELQRAGGRRITAADYLNARPELKQTAATAQGL
ncbi:MAG: methionyl-tRNA formyltransferase [Rudaea sp.]